MLQTKQAENTELSEVIQNLAKLDHNNLKEFFNGVNEIYKELNEKKVILEEELISLEKNVPEWQQKIKDAQTTLEKVRSQTLKAFTDTENQRRDSWKKLEGESPELFEAMLTLAEKKQTLDVLLLSNNFKSKIHEARIILDSRSFDKLRCKMDEISNLCQTADTVSYVAEESFNEHFKKHTRVFIDRLRNMVIDMFTFLKFPFETAVDHQALQDDFENTADILQTLHVLYDYLEEDERVSIMDIIFAEFQKRFTFHFYGLKRTNNPSKPEWFYSEILAWISANVIFIEGYIQPLYDELEPNVFVTEEFIECLVSLAAAKVRELISSEAFVNDRRLLSHLIDETVIFEKELQEVYLYPESSPHAVSELCRRDVLESWVEMERDTIAVAIDNILNDENAYDYHFLDDSEVDEHPIPKFAETFVILMQSMTERYRSIPDERIQCQFLKLQLITVDEFRYRIIHIAQACETPFTYPYPQLLNALWYIAEVLDEWSASPDFIRLQRYASSRNLTIKGAFDDQASLYRHVWK